MIRRIVSLIISMGLVSVLLATGVPAAAQDGADYTPIYPREVSTESIGAVGIVSITAVPTGEPWIVIAGHEALEIGTMLPEDPRQIILWDFDDKKVVASTSLEIRTSFELVRFHPDGQMMVATGESGTVQLWRVSADGFEPDGDPLYVVNDQAMNDAAFSPDGHYLAVAGNDQNIGFVRLWDVATRQFVPIVWQHQIDPVQRISFHPNSQQLAVATCAPPDEESLAAEGLDLDPGLLATSEAYTTEATLEPGIMATTEYLAREVEDTLTTAYPSDQCEIDVFDMDSGQLVLGSLHKHEATITGLAFSPDGRHLASVDENGMALWWDTRTGEALVIQPEKDSLEIESGIYFSPDGRLLATYRGLSFLLWETAALAAGQIKPVVMQHNNAVNEIAFSGDSQRLLALQGRSSNLYLTVWDVSDNARGQPALCANPALLHSGPIVGLLRGNGETIITVENDGAVGQWDLSEGCPAGNVQAALSEGTVTAAALDGTRNVLALGTSEGTISWWNIKSQQVVGAALSLPGAVPVRALTFSPDGQWLIVGDEAGLIHRWNTTTQQWGDPLAGHTGAINALACDPGGIYLASGSADMTARIWDMTTGTELSALRAFRNQVLDVVFSPTELVLATGSADTAIRLWNITDPAAPQLQTMLSVRGVPAHLAFDQTGKRLASVGDTIEILLWDLSQAKPASVLVGELNLLVTGITFDASGHMILAADESGNLGYWTIR